MKILLLNPPYCLPEDNRKVMLKGKFFLPPLGIASISAYLKKYGYDIRAKDMFDWDWPKIENFIELDDSDIVGITCVTNQHFNSRLLAGLFKKKKKKPIIVFGGPHATCLHEQIISHFPVDFVVRGEGENTFLELVKAIETKKVPYTVKGLTFKSDGKIIKTADRELIPDLDSLPFPTYADYDLEAYIPYLDYEPFLGKDNRKKITLPILTARGCPNKCNFCSCPVLWNNKVRLRSPGNVLNEIKRLKELGVKHFMFSDDTFLLNFDRVKKFCNLIIDNGINITWSSAGRVEPVSCEVLELMKKAGCFRIFFGVESGSPRILKNINKNITQDQICNAFNLSRKAKMDAYAFIMVGNPGEDNSTIAETISILRKSKPDGIVAGITQVFPGTELEDLAKSEGFINESYWLNKRFSPLYTHEHDAFSLTIFFDKIMISELLRKKKFVLAVNSLTFLCLKEFLRFTKLYKIIYYLKDKLKKKE
ncbi:MAG: radical SAM protein [Candidatus Omnitrophica bacterium]|nr:radical SAM protein [Candidatus Omnitrophota bacterium]